MTFTCLCGALNDLPPYIAAYWYDVQTLTCGSCGRVHRVLAGKIVDALGVPVPVPVGEERDGEVGAELSPRILREAQPFRAERDRRLLRRSNKFVQGFSLAVQGLFSVTTLRYLLHFLCWLDILTASLAALRIVKRCMSSSTAVPDAPCSGTGARPAQARAIGQRTQ